MPLLFIAVQLFDLQLDLWSHSLKTKFFGYISNSFLLVVSVSCLTGILGTIAGYSISKYEFYGRKFIAFALLLPFAVPSYLMGYIYVFVFQFGGEAHLYVQSLWVRWGWDALHWVSIRNFWGASIVLALALFPYVYLASLLAFRNQSQQIEHASRTLGHSKLSTFFKVTLPMARPQIMASLTLVTMEVLADFGTVDHFAIDTLTSGVYRSWIGMGSIVFASQLAMVLLVFVFCLTIWEQNLRKRSSFTAQTRPQTRIHASKRTSILLNVLLWTPVFLSFIFPICYLIYALFIRYHATDFQAFYQMARSQFWLAALCATLCVVLGVIVSTSARLAHSSILRKLLSLASFGYAFPGAVLAVGILLFLGSIESVRDWLITATSLARFVVHIPLLSGSVVVLIFAYCVRFVSVPYQTHAAELHKISHQLPEAARLLGSSPWHIFCRIQWPFLRGPLAASFVLVFVDIIKELPATMLLRPFGFETLAVKTYLMASDERLLDAAPEALSVILMGILPVLFLGKLIIKSESHA